MGRTLCFSDIHPGTASSFHCHTPRPSLTPTPDATPSKRTAFHGWPVHALAWGGSAEGHLEFALTKPLQYNMPVTLNKCMAATNK